MWKLKNIKAENIVSFHELKVNIEQGVATLIFGLNKDNENQKANGSGKSSLIEALSFGLTGETLRKVKVDEIINDEFEDASVTLTLDNDFDKSLFVINRVIHRKGAQEIECHKYDADGAEIETDKTIQPSVADYNKFIFDELGLTKDDIYSNYVLCRAKYKSFFDCSDKDKKEIINRFSNGIIVDEALEIMRVDVDRAGRELDERQRDVARCDGKIDAINEQMNEAYLAKQDAARTKNERIQTLKQKIAEKRAEKEETENRIAASNKRLDKIDEIGDKIESLESSNSSLEECYAQIKEYYQILNFDSLDDYPALINGQKKEIEDCENGIGSLKERIEKVKGDFLNIKNEHKAAVSEYNKYTDICEKCDDEEKRLLSQIRAEVDNMGERIDEAEKKIKEKKNKYDKLTADLAVNKNILHGIIECPKCHHRFSLEPDVDINKVKKDIDDITEEMGFLVSETKQEREFVDNLKEQISKKDNEWYDISRKSVDRNNRLLELSKNVRKQQERVAECISHINSMEGSMNALQNKIMVARGKIDSMRKNMFDNVFNTIDSKIDAGENYIRNLRDNISHYEGIIEQYRQNIKELEESKSDDIMGTLEQSKKAYEKELAEVSAVRDKAASEFEVLKNQEGYFISFKTHLANLKIDAISAVTNEYLKKIGSDLRVYLEGFKVLKSGKVRDKITVNILRNGIDCGSIDKLSAGEKTRVCLASIIALQHLTNSACDNGKGLDIIVADEILDASDFDGLMSYCAALNSLGLTSLIITQNAIAESYPYKLLVVKENGISTIKN